jgi:hypothetical protein
MRRSRFAAFSKRSRPPKADAKIAGRLRPTAELIAQAVSAMPEMIGFTWYAYRWTRVQAAKVA